MSLLISPASFKAWQTAASAPLPPRGSTAHLGSSGLHYGFFHVCFTFGCTLRACKPEQKMQNIKSFITHRSRILSPPPCSTLSLGRYNSHAAELVNDGRGYGNPQHHSVLRFPGLGVRCPDSAPKGKRRARAGQTSALYVKLALWITEVVPQWRQSFPTSRVDTAWESQLHPHSPLHRYLFEATHCARSGLYIWL